MKKYKRIDHFFSSRIFKIILSNIILHTIFEVTRIKQTDSCLFINDLYIWIFFFILNHIKQVWLALCRRNTNQIVVICINDVCTIFTSMTISFSCKPLPIFFSFKQYSSLSVVLSIYKKKKYLKPTFRHNHKLHNTF